MPYVQIGNISSEFRSDFRYPVDIDNRGLPNPRADGAYVLGSQACGSFGIPNGRPRNRRYCKQFKLHPIETVDWNTVFITVFARQSRSNLDGYDDAITTAPRTHRTDTTTDGLIRRLGTRYLFVLAAVALLILVDQAVVQPLLVRLDRFAPVINLSGRQRMLSQRLTKSALLSERAISEQAAREAREELKITLKQWSDAHEQLRHGEPGQGIARITSPAIVSEWEHIEPHYQAMAAAARKIINSDGFPLEPGQNAAVSTIVEHQAKFLSSMDDIVNLMESEANREVRRLRALALGIAAMIIGLIVGLGWFVVRPATRMIRTQVDDLETRVEERTAALATALNELKAEVVEREKAESQNKRLAAQLAHADRVESIGHLAVGLAHELNHPLGTIANYAEACDVLLNREDGFPSSKIAKFVIQIRDASLRAGQIVRRMRNFVQPNANDTAETDVRPLIDEIVALCLPEIERNQVALSTKLDSQPHRVNVDAVQIQQVLVNLVQNAIQAMAGIPDDDRQLLIRTELVAHLVRIDVIDSGPGFSAIEAERIFEPFTSTKRDGLGVGLSICRSIIENHHGAIWAESAPTGGAVVSFTLPVVPPHDVTSSLQTYSICC